MAPIFRFSQILLTKIYNLLPNINLALAAQLVGPAATALSGPKLFYPFI